MIKEFKEFIARGSMLDLAVAFVMGAAFGKIITSLVNDVVMPVVGLLLGKVDFSNLFISLSGNYKTLDEAVKAGAPVIKYGVFINSIIDFVIVGFVMFLIVKQANRFKKAEAPAVKTCEFCGTNIPAAAVRCPNCTSQLAQE
jgi:large conductance mechanosensitive channel